jgi:hypothetical protein
MAHFILIHTRAIDEIAQETVFTMFRDLVRAKAPGATWLRSWMSVDATRLFCLWEAADEEHIRAALGPERLAMLPIQAAYEVVDVDPAFFA